jgi:hypothetical protein
VPPVEINLALVNMSLLNMPIVDLWNMPDLTVELVSMGLVNIVLVFQRARISWMK